MTGRRRVLVPLAAIILAALGAWVIAGGLGRPAAGQDQTPRLPDLPELAGDEDSAEREAALETVAALVDEPEEAWLPDTLDQAPEIAVEALPPGTELRPRPDTWRRRGRIAAVAVDVTRSGAATDVFVVYLVRTGQGWRVSHTVPVQP